MPNLKITQLVADTTPGKTDLITSVKSPFGAGSNRKVTIANLFLHAPSTQITGSLGINTSSIFPYGITFVGSMYGNAETYEFDRIAQPGAGATAALTGVPGNVDNGTHVYIFAYGTISGYNTESSANTSNSVHVVDKTINGQITVSNIPQSPSPEVNQIFIFRDFNSDGLFLFVDQIAAGVTSYVDNKDNASLGVTAPSNNTTGSFVADGDFTAKSRIHGASTTIRSANDLVLGNANQNIVIVGSTINAISTDNWFMGDDVTLIFSGALTVKNNTTGGAGTAPLFLAGSVDLVTAANTVLGLTFDGAQWQETFRKVA